MTLQRFQSIVLRLGNQLFVRHYLWLNYPNDPQLLGIELIGEGKTGRRVKRPLKCECGKCETCLHRAYVANGRERTRLSIELEEAGFTFDETRRMWTIPRTEVDT